MEINQIKANLRLEALKAAIEFSKNAENKITNTEIIKMVGENFYKWVIDEED